MRSECGAAVRVCHAVSTRLDELLALERDGVLEGDGDAETPHADAAYRDVVEALRAWKALRGEQSAARRVAAARR